MKREYWLAAIAMVILCAGLAAGIPALLPPRPGVTKANFDRIEIGMQKEQVDEILGERGRFPGIDGFGSYTHTWVSDDGARCSVTFTLFRGGVHAKEWTPSTETITDKLRRWLSLPAN